MALVTDRAKLIGISLLIEERWDVLGVKTKGGDKNE
jgi:hypothetical protein